MTVDRAKRRSKREVVRAAPAKVVMETAVEPDDLALDFSDDDGPTFDDQIREVVDLAGQLGRGTAFPNTLQVLRKQIKKLRNEHRDPDVRIALELAERVLGFAVAMDAVEGLSRRPKETPTRIRAAWNVVVGDATLRSTNSVFAPSVVGTTVHRCMQNWSRFYELADSDADRNVAEDRVVELLTEFLPRAPAVKFVREALLTVNFDGGRTRLRSKWDVLADLLKSGGIAVKNGASLKQALKAHAK
jgi:hypothetical protein